MCITLTNYNRALLKFTTLLTHVAIDGSKTWSTSTTNRQRQCVENDTLDQDWTEQTSRVLVIATVVTLFSNILIEHCRCQDQDLGTREAGTTTFTPTLLDF